MSKILMSQPDEFSYKKGLKVFRDIAVKKFMTTVYSIEEKEDNNNYTIILKINKKDNPNLEWQKCFEYLQPSKNENHLAKSKAKYSKYQVYKINKRDDV
ncbi:hypothetical protein [Cobetia amphilecti]|uniref:hypothetical protein n=1 Tax=Cobetia amphilecti TaxID=1055104 RepID=UPI003296A9D4